jgi:hypothetical protein
MRFSGRFARGEFRLNRPEAPVQHHAVERARRACRRDARRSNAAALDAIACRPCSAPAFAGVSGRGDIAPEPVVAGELSGREVLPVVTGGGPLLAVLLWPLMPAITRNAISATTAMPAIQPHFPLTASSRRSTGALNRGSV